MPIINHTLPRAFSNTYATVTEALQYMGFIILETEKKVVRQTPRKTFIKSYPIVKYVSYNTIKQMQKLTYAILCSLLYPKHTVSDN
jgi:hypothetical protein